ncbi:hypothetical protein J3R73_001332 [Labrys monachus]|uniref:Uncharacterized protein n=1 Tax=Labrys monachus TaxID=217067 RepID=A0ABU0FA88_9HYPH|nr:hypothetical protein [Labrys monachus]
MFIIVVVQSFCRDEPCRDSCLGLPAGSLDGEELTTSAEVRQR